MINFKAVVDPLALTNHKFPVVRIADADGKTLANLDVEATALNLRKIPTRITADFLLVAATIYALDKLVSRTDAPDAWTRDFSVEIPVSAPTECAAASIDLKNCVSFLTGDNWNFKFIQRRRELFGASSLSRVVGSAKPEAISLFSGGMDSLCGVINWLESNPAKGLLLAAHRDGQMHGPYTDQKNILPELQKAYPGRIHAALVRVGNSGFSPEITLRSRSIVFIALATLIASGHGFAGDLILPENGTIALNVPLSPSRRGSCSTRTAHPFYVKGLQRVLSDLGINVNIKNPLGAQTKGEVAASCLNPDLFKKTVFLSVSCAKRGHNVTWLNRQANGCGMCMPCIYRRAALNKAGLDTEKYGRDVCRGEVDFNDQSISGPADLRACISFLQRNPSRAEIQRLLLANGSLDPTEMPLNADLVVRAFEEIRELLRAKATREIKRMAGIK